jgi:UDP-glucose 4-epimerase
MKTILLTGGAGFIGTNLTKRLLNDGYRVICIDSLVLGKKENILQFLDNRNYKFHELDISVKQNLTNILADITVDCVFHLAANSDIQLSGQDPAADYRRTFLTSIAVLEYMREQNIKKLFFSSSGAVYGEKPGQILTEDTPLSPISYYGGSKMASEAFISSYAHMNDIDATIFRFPNVIGPYLTHGVIFDFIKKLRKDPAKLDILGDGTQNKSYIYVEDLIDAISLVVWNDEKGVNIFNVGGNGSTTVKEIADMVCAKLGLKNVQYN